MVVEYNLFDSKNYQSEKMKKIILIFLIISLSRCTIINEPVEPMTSFNTISINLIYENHTPVNSIDTRYYQFYGIPINEFTSLSVPDLKSLTNGAKIRLLEIEFDITNAFFQNVQVGESRLRDVTQFLAVIEKFSLDSELIKDKFTNENLIYPINEKQNKINFGGGIIIDDFNMPTSITQVYVNPLNPIDNEITRISAKLTIKYNQNY